MAKDRAWARAEDETSVRRAGHSATLRRGAGAHLSSGQCQLKTWLKIIRKTDHRESWDGDGIGKPRKFCYSKIHTGYFGNGRASEASKQRGDVIFSSLSALVTDRCSADCPMIRIDPRIDLHLCWGRSLRPGEQKRGVVRSTKTASGVAQSE